MATTPEAAGEAVGVVADVVDDVLGRARLTAAAYWPEAAPVGTGLEPAAVPIRSWCGVRAGIPVNIGDVVKSRLDEVDTESNMIREAYIARR